MPKKIRYFKNKKYKKMKSNFAPFFDYELLSKSRGNEASQSLLFDGVSGTVPTIVNGRVIFGGAANNLGGKSKPFEIGYKRIMDYSAECSKPASKKKVRIKCCALDNCTSEEFATIHLQFRNSLDFPLSPSYGPDSDSIMVPLVSDCGAVDCCRMMASLQQQFEGKNQHYPVTGVASQEGEVWYFDIEAKFAGQDFIVTGAENFLASEVRPNFLSVLTAKQLAEFFDNPIVTDCDPDKPMEAIIVRYKEYVPYFQGNGNGWSSSNVSSQAMMPVHTMIPCFFDPAVAQSMTAKTALLNILNCVGMAATVIPYESIPGSSTCTNGPVFAYCITRTDLGNPAALAQVKADYPTFITVGMTSHVGAVGVSGVSTYTITLLNITSAPAAATFNAVVDTIATGACVGPCLAGECPALTPCTSC